MYRIKTLNKISPAGLSVLDQTRYTISTDVENEDGILVRSADMHDYAFPDALRAVARAGAGTNNIPIDRCSEAGIVVFNTPGANANAVKELAVCALLLASRKISDGVAWVREQAAAGADVEQAVEKGKSQFVGPELSGKMLGVIGLGAIGVQVANIATKLGMTVFGYDPFLSVDGALSLSRLVHRAMDLETIYKNCDYITLHVPQTPETKGMFNEDAFHMMKGGVRILNLARGTLVNDDDMLAALDSGAGLRQGRPVRHRLPQRQNPAGQERGGPPPPGGLHAGERGELRRHGGPGAEGLSGERQYSELGEPAHAGAAVERRVPPVHHPPQRPRRHRQHHRGALQGRGKCGQHDEQVQEGLCLYRGGRGQPHRRVRGRHHPRPGRGVAGAPAQSLNMQRRITEILFHVGANDS